MTGVATLIDAMQTGGVGVLAIVLAWGMIEIVKGLVKRLPTRNGNGNPHRQTHNRCPIIGEDAAEMRIAARQVAESTKEMVTEQRKTHEALKDLHRDLVSMSSQLDRIEKHTES